MQKEERYGVHPLRRQMNEMHIGPIDPPRC